LILAGNYVIPDKCPVNCPFKLELKNFSINSGCFRCPIINCAGTEPLVQPEFLDQITARAWWAWFKELEEELTTDLSPGQKTG